MDNQDASGLTGRNRKTEKMKTQIVKDFEVSREKLGSGSFASVWKGWHRTQRDLLAAVKVISLNKISMRLQTKIDSEIQILKGLRHPNVVQLYDVKQCEKYIILILEFCGGGDLSRYIRERRRPDHTALSQATALHFMRQLAQGMYFLHSRNLVHRDIKPQNLLLSSSDLETAVLKIADFGFARYLAIDPLNMDLAKTLCGSPVYMAPEILSRHSYGANVDLWSAGAVLYEMLFGDPPFRGDTLLDLQRNVEMGLKLPPHAADLDEPCIDVLQRLLKADPEDRISWQDFFCHPFIFQDGMYDLAVDLSVSVGTPTSDFSSQNGADGSWSSGGLSALMSRKASISAETQTSPIQSTPVFRAPMTESEQQNVAVFVKDQLAVAFDIATMAQQAWDEKGPVEAYCLYERAMHLLLEAQRKVAQLQIGYLDDEDLKQKVSTLFGQIYDAAGKTILLMKQPSLPVQCQSVEQLIFAHVLHHAGADGVVEEMLGNVTTANDLYGQGLRLLKYLKTRCAVDSEDRQLIQKYLDAFQRRLSACDV